MTRIKICGLTRPCDIDAVNEIKPEYIGFVFANSRRKVELRQALDLRRKLHSDIIPVGVFVNELAENVVSVVKSGAIDIIQLHGAEDEQYIARLKEMTDAPIIKAIAVQKKGDAQKWEESVADYLMLDNGGGMGRNFNWDLIDDIDKPFFLAGGLCPENVVEAVEKTNPFAVDVSSGVETDGLKDPEKIREFVRRVRNE